MFKSKWFLETRPQFLLLSVTLVAHATALAAWSEDSVNWLHAVLAMVTLVLMHASADALNDWHDYAKTGIDRETKQTPFSGGSGLIPAGVISPKEALGLGIGTLAAGCAVGLYLALQGGWPLLVIGLVGIVMVVGYTPLFTRVGLGEIMAGLGLGTLPIVGTVYLLTGHAGAAAWVSGIPAGFLTYNLLFLNEFPDTEADRTGGRRHMVVLLGKKNARWLYAAVEAGAFVAIVLGVAFRVLTPWALLGLGAGFFAFKAIAGALKDYDSFEGLIPAQAMNVMAVLAINVLLAAGYAIAAIVA